MGWNTPRLRIPAEERSRQAQPVFDAKAHDSDYYVSMPGVIDIAYVNHLATDIQHISDICHVIIRPIGHMHIRHIGHMLKSCHLTIQHIGHMHRTYRLYA